MTEHSDGPGDAWGQKHYKIEDVNEYDTSPAPFIVDAVPFLQSNGVQTVLDAACGQGRNSLYLLQEGFDVRAVDASRKATRLAARLAEQNGYTLTPQLAELQDLGIIQDESLDAIVSVTVLTHIPDPENVLREFHRILRPGGMVIADFASTKDSTFGPISETGIRLSPNVYLEEGTFVKYFERAEDVEALFHLYSDVSSQHISFEEPPHPGSRPYIHEHSSFVITAKK